ncbi:MAG: YjgN family protein [Lautropia sp.]
MTAQPFGGPPLTLQFTGSGSEYFRIWIVNLLLILVTFGIYFPWAKVRRLKYFYSNTSVGNDAVGRHALDFHGQPLRMLIGYAIMTVLFGLYSVAGAVSPAAGIVSVALLCAAAPPLFRAGMRFRLANTSWRGLRFHFDGTTGGAYRVFLPLAIPVVLLAAVLAFGGIAGSALGADATSDDGPGSELGVIGAFFIGGFVVAVLVAYLLAPLIWFRIRAYQHRNYRFGSVASGLELGPGALYRLLLRTSLLAIGAVAAVMLLAFAASLLLGSAAVLTGDPAGAGAAPWLTMMLVPLGVIAAWQVVALPYLQAKQQNLFWSATRSDTVRFTSTLGFGPLARLTAVNWLLIVVTLGLYWPFAAVRLARLRLTAVSLQLRDDPAAIVGAARAAAPGNIGDAAADVFGVDVGL